MRKCNQTFTTDEGSWFWYQAIQFSRWQHIVVGRGLSWFGVPCIISSYKQPKPIMSLKNALKNVCSQKQQFQQPLLG